MQRFLIPVVLATILVLTGCDQATSTGSTAATSTTKSLTVTSTSAYTYWDLSTGTEVTDPATQDWDIAFSYATQGILTNSGATATTQASSGAGGVWYAGTTDFDTVTSTSGADFTEDFAVDTSVSVSTASQLGTSTVSTIVLNQMTKLDYTSGDGSADDPFTNDASAGVYDGEAYYAYNQGVSASGEVYIVRHGDGTSFSKLQITSLTTSQTGSTTSRVRVIKYANF